MKAQLWRSRCSSSNSDKMWTKRATGSLYSVILRSFFVYIHDFFEPHYVQYVARSPRFFQFILILVVDVSSKRSSKLDVGE